ncbi:unnamed protein product [Allacma fusca]|uniref:Uncharacterized protein n=1 Tax=Allacma fusca TaxID=39272 RepID=A0A8J2K7F8_9HEXA|nr:unnamed protein product [Allacma fusca]
MSSVPSLLSDRSISWKSRAVTSVVSCATVMQTRGQDKTRDNCIKFKNLQNGKKFEGRASSIPAGNEIIRELSPNDRKPFGLVHTIEIENTSKRVSLLSIVSFS